MKSFIIIFCLTCSLKFFAQDKVVGNYRDFFGSRIQLNADNTFKYTWHIDMSGSWTKGTWVLRNDTVYFRMIPTYDTLTFIKANNETIDSLILSTDEKSERFTQQQYTSMLLSSGGQNRTPCPDKMFYKNERLYNIKNGKLVKKKQKGFWTGKKYIPWYFKYEEI